MARRYGDSDSGLKVLFFSVLILLTAAGVGAFYWLLVSQPTEVDAITSCPVRDSDRHLVAGGATFVVDVTDPMGFSQVKDIEKRINKVISGLKTFDMVRFYVISSSEPRSARKHSIQIDLSVGEPITLSEFCIPEENNWESPSQKQLQEVLHSLVRNLFTGVARADQGTESSSPILDGLRFVAAESGSNQAGQELTRHHIYIVSDMLENTPGTLSMYRDGWYEDIYLPNKSAFYSSRPQFPDNTKVTVWMLSRPSFARDRQSRELVTFWLDMISGSEREIDLSLVRITGGS